MTKLLLEEGPDSKRLTVQLKDFRGTPLLDMRYWYLDKVTGDMKPTQKGISLTKSNYLGFRSLTVDHHEEIMNFLDVDMLKASHAGDSSVVAEHQRNNRESVSSINVEVVPLKPLSKMYEVKFEGALATVYLNANHPLIDELANEDGLPADVSRALGVVCLSFAVSITKHAGAGEASDYVAEQLELDFSRHAAQLTRSTL